MGFLGEHRCVQEGALKGHGTLEGNHWLWSGSYSVPLSLED